MIGDLRSVLLLPHIKVHNANALSSPYTIGFPAMTAWLGAMHALQRKLVNDGLVSLKFISIAVISHSVNLQTHKGAGDYDRSIVATGNPLTLEGERPPFIEEARCHLDISLIIEYEGVKATELEMMLEQITHHLNSSLKIAGGDIESFFKPSTHKIEEGNSDELHKLVCKLMPGYAIVERRSLLIEATKQGADVLDALLDYLSIHHKCELDHQGKPIWKNMRKVNGWIVPIATGFHGLSDLHEAKNQRDQEMPHRFAEAVVTLGEFRMPHRIESLDEILWYYKVDINSNLYLCQQINNN